MQISKQKMDYYLDLAFYSKISGWWNNHKPNPTWQTKIESICLKL